jgi:hypothetical protein
MSIPHNHPPRIGQKFEYCGAVIEYNGLSECGKYFIFTMLFAGWHFMEYDIPAEVFHIYGVKAIT